MGAADASILKAQIDADNIKVEQAIAAGAPGADDASKDKAASGEGEAAPPGFPSVGASISSGLEEKQEAGSSA